MQNCDKNVWISYIEVPQIILLPLTAFYRENLWIGFEKIHQGKGYYKEALELFKNKLKKEKIKTDRLKSLVRKNNKRMNEIRKRHYYFNREVKIRDEIFNEYFIFLRKLTYLIKSDYYNLQDIHFIMKERGIWRPFKRGKDLNKYQIGTIIQSTKKILKKAIKFGGSTINDYISPDGTLGNFQNNFKVYGKEGKKISGYEIKKMVLYGRSTFFCPEIQKWF